MRFQYAALALVLIACGGRTPLATKGDDGGAYSPDHYVIGDGDGDHGDGDGDHGDGDGDWGDGDGDHGDGDGDHGDGDGDVGDGDGDWGDGDGDGDWDAGTCWSYEYDCDNGYDEDCDGYYDYEDYDCRRDNDGGPGCNPIEYYCDDGVDDDCDGYTDYSDFDCNGGMTCSSYESSCSDGIDDDCDGYVDCSDFDCDVACGRCTRSESSCFNGRDDDCDGQYDCADSNCRSECGGAIVDGGAECLAREVYCSNGTDDDCDGLIDCRDPNCNRVCRDSGPRDAGVIIITDAGGPHRPDAASCAANEIGPAQCSNGIDDDCDGRDDCDDSDCAPFGPMGECCDGRDNDGDGYTDLFACRCFTSTDCVGVGDFEQVCWADSYSVCAPRCNFYGGDAYCRMFGNSSSTCNSMTGECEF